MLNTTRSIDKPVTFIPPVSFFCLKYLFSDALSLSSEHSGLGSLNMLCMGNFMNSILQTGSNIKLSASIVTDTRYHYLDSHMPDLTASWSRQVHHGTDKF